ncbi:MAG: putative toxin-antitoxin system toxin component, PIN family [Nitrospirota bacterium]
MIAHFAVVDTNVVVSGLLTRNAYSPTGKILDGMLRGAFPFLLSADLLAEYRAVLLRPKIRSVHGLSPTQIDELLAAIAGNATLREPDSIAAPNPYHGDDHLWRLITIYPDTTLVTGDLALFDTAPRGTIVLSPRRFLTLIK